ncbi:hypothetical protein Gpo141_00014722 [Globisporangium polare]
MFSAKSLLVLSATLAAASLASAQTFVYTFDPQYAGGVQGYVKVKYATPTGTRADVSANLDFSKVDVAAIQKLDGNCTGGAPTTYKWHIHTKWSSPKSSDSFAMCSKAATGNHYDPLFACSANSEFAESAQCIPKIPLYNCNPTSYAMDPRVCEKGDLGGKFGDLKLDTYKQVRTKWTDVNYPRVDENTPQWNVILHAVCGKNTPRVACALGKRTDKQSGYSSNNNGYGYGKSLKVTEGEEDEDMAFDEVTTAAADDASDDAVAETDEEEAAPVATNNAHKTHVRIVVHGA